VFHSRSGAVVFGWRAVEGFLSVLESLASVGCSGGDNPGQAGNLFGLRGVAGTSWLGLGAVRESPAQLLTRRCSGPASWRVPRQAVSSAELERKKLANAFLPDVVQALSLAR
jgi:hypothetical protein